MYRKIFIPLILTILIITVIFLEKKVKIYDSTPNITINNRTIDVEIADNDAERAQGLSGRKNLENDHGMLFIFPTSGFYSFWMKDMNFPLDFVWIDQDKVVDIMENIPQPAKGEMNLPTYTSTSPVDKVLEISAGDIKKLNIAKGDRIKYNY